VSVIEGTAIRTEIVEALKADLMGPFNGDATSTEVLELPPSRWYWTGFLAPENAREAPEIEANDELGAGPDDDDDAEGVREPEAKQKKAFAASLGVSVLLPPRTEPDSLTVHIRFATYLREERAPEDSAKKPKLVWKRVPHGPIRTTLALDNAQLRDGTMVPNTPKVWLEGEIRTADGPGLAAGTRVLSLFLVNRRSDAERGKEDENFLFQVELELEYERGFVRRPNHLGEHASDGDERVADLQYRGHHEWAVGHGVSVAAQPSAAREHVTRVRTTFFPTSEVRKVVTHDVAGVTTEMDALAQLEDGAALAAALSPLLEAYGAWIAHERARNDIGGSRRTQTRDELAQQASDALARMRKGIERLRDDAEVRLAFRLANEAMADAARRRSPQQYETTAPKWRLFQLAFLLLCLEDIADEQSPHRDRVELIFFPTGGGKTEAYLGVIAVTLLLRRMRGQLRPDKGLGVAVLLRYTLRLLTLDQLGRAATLICALELIRRRDQTLLGQERFAIGLWVGRSATANTLAEVHKAILEYRSSASETASSPFPLASCPACRSALQRDALHLEPSAQKPERVVVGCSNVRCAFTSRQGGLPVLFVDEQIYRELPAFVVATVDKFAMLPWRGETGMLFGRVNAKHGAAFYGPLDTPPKAATALPEGLYPPELIVQDELHLIAGPLGTMVGLYENAVEYLSTRRGSVAVRPKVIASTATARRAKEQIRALFGRPMCLFPPQGVDASETFFAKVDHNQPGRLYLGVAASGRSLKGTLLRTYVALLSAAQKHDDPKRDTAQASDAYMTLAGYFNSLRELGGMRRLVEDEVRTRCVSVEDKRPLDFAGPHPFLKKRDVQMEPVELTSRESTSHVKLAKERLALPHHDPKHVDVLLASNMISVGVDIDRLGLMVVAGQPKTTSEYIQASSRVGRKHPGLVVTCFNLARPRDRSHYERFDVYHQSFYRFVEAASLTPFSGPALDRGLAGTLVAMARLGCEALTRPEAVMDLAASRMFADEAAQYLAQRAGDHDGEGSESARVERVRARCVSLLDSWQTIVQTAREEAAAQRSYSRFDRDKSVGKPLLFTAIDPARPSPDSDEAKFQAPTSMRDVEESVPLWVRKSFGGPR
jgi:hypothetical protein